MLALTLHSGRRGFGAALLISIVCLAPDVSAAPVKKKPGKGDSKEDSAKVSKLTAGGPTLAYELFRKKVEIKVAEKREEQITGLLRLLELGPKESEVPDIKFRIAELYYEKSRFYFFRAQEADDKIPQASTPQQKDDLEAEKKRQTKESKVWVHKALDIYKEIRDKYPKYSRMPEVLFALGQSYWSEQQYQAAIEVYAELIRNFKDSPLVSEAWIAFGEFYFNEGDVNKALKSYEKAAEDKRSRVYGFALYKQAWCYYNLSDWKKALSKFKATVIYSQLASELQGENKIALGREAQKDFVRTYAHVGDPQRAKFEFADLLGKESCNETVCWELLASLAGLWFDEGYFDESASVYGQLIKMNPRNTKNPFFQSRIVDEVSRGGDKQRVINEARKLVEVYEATKDLVAKMPADAKDLEKAKADVKEGAELAESTVRKLAQTWNQEAKKTRQPKTYEYAKSMYVDYLKLFPKTKFSYEMRFQLADLYYKLEMFNEAATEYEATVKADPKGQYTVEAANDNVLALEEYIKDLKIKAPKPSEKPLEIHKEKMRLIEACDRYVQVVPVEKADKLVAVKFKAAKIYYDWSHYQEAIKRFDELVTNHPEAKEAEYAANLVIDIYNIKQDWRSLYDYAAKYNKIEALLKDREKLAKDLAHFSEYAKFKLVQILEENVKKQNGDLKLVAKAYQDFYEEFPKSENADKALFNSSVAWDKVGEKKTADKLRQKLLKEFKDSPLCKDVFYYTAKAHEEKTNYKTAAKLLAEFAAKYPDDKRARDALYNASVFYSGVGDIKNGTKLREEYLQKYGKVKEGEKESSAIYYSIARDLELAGRWSDAAKRYEEFVKNFPKAPQVWEALHAQATIRRDKLRQAKDADKIEGQLVWLLENAKKKGLEVTPQAAQYVGLIAFNRLEKDYAEYKKMRLKTPSVQNPKPFQQSVVDKARAREKVIKAYTNVVTKYQQAESTIASLYRIAESWDDFVSGIVSTPCPHGTPQEVCVAIKEELEKMAAPARESAAAAYKTCVAKSNELNTFTSFSTKCVHALEQVQPDAYPPIVEHRIDYTPPEKVQNLQSNGLILQGYSPEPAALAAGSNEDAKAAKPPKPPKKEVE
jgi:tetratricopeptide (TPR) repeat protein